MSVKPDIKKLKQRKNVSDTFLEHETFLKKFIKRFFSNIQDVEDVVQETYLRAYVAEQKTEISQHKSFLFSTAKNIALTKLSKKSKQITDFIEEYSNDNNLESEPSSEEVFDGQQQLKLYCAAVAALDGKCREAFLLKKVHGMSHKEIAKQMSLSLSSIEKYLHTALIAVDRYVVRSNAKKPLSSFKTGLVNGRGKKNQ